MISKHEVYENGVLISTTEVEVPDADPTDAERIAELEATVAALLELLEG